MGPFLYRMDRAKANSLMCTDMCLLLSISTAGDLVVLQKLDFVGVEALDGAPVHLFVTMKVSSGM